MIQDILKKIGVSISTIFYSCLSAIRHPLKCILCKKYSFLQFTNTDKANKYQYTYLDIIPVAYKKCIDWMAFCKELKVAIRRDGGGFKLEDIDPVGGRIMFTTSQCAKNAQRVLDKYSLLSIGYCSTCGKPARYKTAKPSQYWCDFCFNNRFTTTRSGIKLFKKYRLTREDIPFITRGNEIITVLEYYGIDFTELWDLDTSKEELL